MPMGTRLFISHSHEDVALASRLLQLMNDCFEVRRSSEILCSSVPGYKLEIGTLIPEALRQALAGTQIAVALLTPNSITSRWVLFELGAVWGASTKLIPMRVGDIDRYLRQLPGQLQSHVHVDLTSTDDLYKLTDQLQRELEWPQKPPDKIADAVQTFAKFAEKLTFDRSVVDEITDDFGQKTASISPNQSLIVSYISSSYRIDPKKQLKEEEVATVIPKPDSSLYYRLETLRLLGFLVKHKIDVPVGKWPKYTWTLSEPYAKYRKSAGL
jgi:hypothetical protein